MRRITNEGSALPGTSNIHSVAVTVYGVFVMTWRVLVGTDTEVSLQPR